MSIEADIERALFAHCVTLSPALPTAYPNVPFDPVEGTTYYDVRHFPNDAVNLAWGSVTELSGVLQIGIVCAPGVGTPPIREYVGAIAEHFAKGTELREGNAVVKIDQKPFGGAPVVDGQKTIIPVTIRYRCFEP